MTWGVYHDLVSPYLYLAYGQVDRICKAHEALEVFARRCALRGVPAHGLASGSRAFLVVPSPGSIPLVCLGGEVDSDDGYEGHDCRMQGDRGVAVPAKQCRRD